MKKNQSKFQALLLSLCVSVGSLSAWADFQMVDPSTPQSQSFDAQPDLKGFQAVTTHVSIITDHGNPTATSCAPSFGTQLPIKDALDSILPDNWHLYESNSLTKLNTPMLATWHCDGQTSWRSTLEGVLRQNHLQASIWWDRSVVSIQPDASMIQSMFAQQKQNNPLAAAQEVKVNGLVFQQVAHMDELNRTWILKKDEHLSDVLGRWCKGAGWTLVWKTQRDWVIPALTTYQGDFRGAISATIDSLNQGGALIRATRYLNNHTLVIDDVQDLTPHS